MKVFGHSAGVAFPAPAAIEADVCRLYGVRVIGRTSAVRERYYAISAERRSASIAPWLIPTSPLPPAPF